tara:strand:+ start:264 stop:737 length:474 start_codon:yes stop_codon:yes gene_type:complete
MIQKAFMTGAICLIGRGTNIQPLVATIVQTAYLTVVLKLAPYVNDDEDRASVVAASGLAFTYLIASVLFSENQANVSSFNGKTLEVILLVVTIGSFLIQLAYLLKLFVGTSCLRKKTLGAKTKTTTIIPIQETESVSKQLAGTNNSVKSWGGLRTSK